MELDFNSQYPEFEKYEEFYASIAEVVLKTLKIKCDPIISVSLVNNEYIHQINREYRNIDKVTDVISFAFLDDEHQYDKILYSKGVVILGDVYISIDKAKEQAEEYHHSLHRELSFLFVHGLLHLCGYDHMNKEDEKVMFGLQDKILEELGV